MATTEKSLEGLRMTKLEKKMVNFFFKMRHSWSSSSDMTSLFCLKQSSSRYHKKSCHLNKTPTQQDVISKISEQFYFLNCFSEEKGERSVVLTQRLILVKNLVQRVTGLSDLDVLGVYNYGCWCGPRGQGKVVDNFD